MATWTVYALPSMQSGVLSPGAKYVAPDSRGTNTIVQTRDATVMVLYLIPNLGG